MQAVLQQGLVPIAQLTKLLLLMNLKPASYSSKSEDYRAPALAAYNVSKGSTVLCQVSDRYFPAAQVKAAHIVRLEWSTVAAHMGVPVNSPENIIFMHRKIEEAYDRQEWCLLVQPDGSMQVEVLRKSLLKQEKNRDTIIGSGGELGTPRDPQVKRGCDDKLSWADLQGQQLIIPVGSTTQPAKRCVTLHALSAQESAVGVGWIGKDEIVVPETGWSSPGFDEQLMGRLLRDVTELVGQGSCSEAASDAAPGVTPEDSYS